jgi:predicted DCC family thiol-disulfide oxidoreductase YuxK
LIAVFYDGKCGLCRREISHYQRIAPAGVFDWIDITVNPEPFESRGFTVPEGLKALHVLDDSVTMRKGLAAFAVIWQKLPALWPMLALMLRIPLVLPLAEKIYAAFASWRFKKLGYDQCQLKP